MIHCRDCYHGVLTCATLDLHADALFWIAVEELRTSYTVGNPSIYDMPRVSALPLRKLE